MGSCVSWKGLPPPAKPTNPQQPPKPTNPTAAAHTAASTPAAYVTARLIIHP